MGQRCGYRRVRQSLPWPPGMGRCLAAGGRDGGPAPAMLLSAPAIRSAGKHKGWEGSAKGGLNFGAGVRDVHVPVAVGTAVLAVTAAASAALQTRTLSPLSRGLSTPPVSPRCPIMQPKPLKLTITQSECLFGVIQAPGESEGGEEEGSCFFSTRYRQPRSAEVVLKQDECLNKSQQTALPGGGLERVG